MSSPSISKERRALVIELRRKGESYAAIGRDRRVNLDRRTAKKIFEEWEEEHSLSETKETRLLLKRELMADHVKELLGFARGLAVALGVPEPSDARSGEEVFRAFVESHGRVNDVGALDVADRDQRKLMIQRNERLCRDFLAHTEAGELWTRASDYLRARDRLLDGQVELEEHVERLLRDRLMRSQDASIALAERWGVIRRLAEGLSLAFVDAAVHCADAEPLPTTLEQLDSRGREAVRTCGTCAFRQDRVHVQFPVPAIAVTIEGVDLQMHTIVGRAVEGVAEELADGEAGRYHMAKLGEALLVMLKCHDELMAESHSPRLQAVILDSRCDHCPV